LMIDNDQFYFKSISKSNYSVVLNASRYCAGEIEIFLRNTLRSEAALLKPHLSAIISTLMIDNDQFYFKSISKSNYSVVLNASRYCAGEI
ncbi:hypothetical protein BOQ60_25700, partial [Chryseobacterium sp. CH1]